jgi:hypothetical protein
MHRRAPRNVVPDHWIEQLDVDVLPEPAPVLLQHIHGNFLVPTRHVLLVVLASVRAIALGEAERGPTGLAILDKRQERLREMQLVFPTGKT